jgi:hypothetical protein
MPFLSITPITCDLRVCGINKNKIIRVTPQHPKNHTLIDSGANINITNDLSLLTNVREITPFTISVALNADNTIDGCCTMQGLLPLSLYDRQFFHTKCYYCPNAVKTIISPQTVLASTSIFSQWTQVGFKDPKTPGHLCFTNATNNVSMSLSLTCHNGLYYSHTISYTSNPPPFSTQYDQQGIL